MVHIEAEAREQHIYTRPGHCRHTHVTQPEDLLNHREGTVSKLTLPGDALVPHHVTDPRG